MSARYSHLRSPATVTFVIAIAGRLRLANRFQPGISISKLSDMISFHAHFSFYCGPCAPRGEAEAGGVEDGAHHVNCEYRRLSSGSVGHGDNRDRLGVCPRQRWTASSILVMRRNKFEFFRLLGLRIWSADQKSKSFPVSQAFFAHPCGTAIPLSKATTSA
jgi:hypothetical protein